MKSIAFFRTGLLLIGGIFCCCHAGAAGAKLNPLTEEVVAALDLNRPELREIKAATSPEARQEALFRCFMERKTPLRYREKITSLDKQSREWADAALKHRFIGQPKYPLQFRGEKAIDWDTNPFPDPEWLLQFHRLSWWPALGKAFAQSKDERFAREFTAELESYRLHMFRPEALKRHPGWRGLEIAGRIGVGTGLHELYRNSESFTSYDLASLLWLLHKQEDILFRKKKRATDSELGNHEMHIWSALLNYYYYFPEFKTHAERAQHVLDNVIKAQDILVFDDGVINECITSYHTAYPVQFLDIYKQARQYNPDVKFPPRYMEKIERGITAVMLWSHPDGSAPQFGDAWTSSPGSAHRYVGRFLGDFKRPDWEYYVSGGKKGVKPEKLIHSLGRSGYSAMRSGWDPKALFLVMKNSDVDYLYHNHMDNLSFELSGFGKHLMVDSGCYCYNGSAGWRGWFRQSSVHPLVTLDNRQVMARGKLLWSSESPNLNVVSGWNQAYENCDHTRTIFMVDGKYIVILDELTGTGTGTLRQHFQFMPGPAALNPGTLTAVTRNVSGPNLLVRSVPVDGAKLTMNEESGWISQVYMKKEPRPAFAFLQEKTDASPRRFLTLLAPTGENDAIWSTDLSLSPGEIKLTVNNYENYTIRFDAKAGTASLEKRLRPARRIPEHDAYMTLERRSDRAAGK